MNTTPSPASNAGAGSQLGGLARFASTNLIGRISGRGLGLASFVLLARLGGEQTFGWVVLVFAWCSIAGMFAAAGLEWPVLRFTKLHLDEGRADLARGLARLAEGVPLIVGTVIGCLLIVILKVGTDIGGSWSELGWFIPVVPLSAYLLVRRNLMLSLERPVLALMPVNIVRPLVMLAIMLSLAASSHWHLDYTAAAAAMGLSFIVAGIWAKLVARRDIRNAIGTGPSTRETRTWTGIGMAMVLVTGGFMVLNLIDTLLLGALATLDDVAAYNASYRIVSLMAMPLIAIQSATASRLSAAHTHGRIDDLQSITRWISRLALCGTSVIFIALLGFGDLVLAVFGEHFMSARVPMLILAGAYLFSSWTGCTGYVMNMTNRQKLLAVIILLACAFNVIGNLLLIPVWGMTGAAISTATTIVAWNAAVIVLLRRSTGRWMLWWPGTATHRTPTMAAVEESGDPTPATARDGAGQDASTPRVLIIDPSGSRRARSAFLIESLEAAGAIVQVVHAGGGLTRSCLALRQHIRKAAPVDYAVCFAHGPRALAAWIAWRLSSKGPFAIYLGGDPGGLLYRELNPDSSARSFNIWPRIRLRLNLAVMKVAMRRADALICVSEYLATTIRSRHAPKAATFVMPPCTRTMPRASQEGSISRQGNGSTRVLTVTNLRYRAKRDGALAIILGLNSFCAMSGERVEHFIAGSGAFLPDLSKSLEARDLHPNLQVNLLGHVTDMEALYEDADVFAYSSTKDAYPNVIVEAMSFGLPLIVNDHPLFDEFLGKDRHAIRFNTDTPDAFAKALQVLMESAELRGAMIEANLELVRKTRSPVDTGRQALLFLHSLQARPDHAL